MRSCQRTGLRRVKAGFFAPFRQMVHYGLVCDGRSALCVGRSSLESAPVKGLRDVPCGGRRRLRRRSRPRRVLPKVLRKVEEKHSDGIVEWLMWDSGVATDEATRYTCWLRPESGVMVLCFMYLGIKPKPSAWEVKIFSQKKLRNSNIISSKRRSHFESTTALYHSHGMFIRLQWTWNLTNGISTLA